MKVSKNLNFYSWFFIAVLFLSCSEDAPAPSSETPQIRPSSNLPDGVAVKRNNAIVPGDGVMMQAFYWDVIDGGIWWNIVSQKIDNWADDGIDAIWIPPISKAQSGRFSMGYDPTDYFDFGDYDQNATVETRFGNRSELENLISKAHENNIAVIADMVINHNSGGALEFNQFTGTETFTLFNVASNLFNRNKYDFLPNGERTEDSGRFAGFPDLDLQSDYVQAWMWKSEQSVANFYMNILNIDGWRFDYVKGYSPDIVKDWVNTVGGYAIGENFDGNLQGVVLPWVEASGQAAFDFPNFFNMRNAFNSNNLSGLAGQTLFSVRPDKAVTFVGNHDTENRSDNDLDFPNAFEQHAYAYILMAPGYPCVFYTHYENSGEEQKENIKKLIQLRAQLAAGNWNVELANANEFIASRNGEGDKPGLLLYLNINNASVSQEVRSPWSQAVLKDYTDNITTTVNTDMEGNVTISAPANGYAIWSVENE